MQTKKKVVIVSVPFTDTTAPIMAPAALKSIVLKAGHDCAAFDLNAEVFAIVNSNKNTAQLLQFLYYEELHRDVFDDTINLFEYMINRIISHNPDIICLSLLHYQCQVTAKWLCMLIKQRYPHVEIIIGGTGITGEIKSTNISWASSLRDVGLIDNFIRGDGEDALYQYLIGNKEYNGINAVEWQKIVELDNIPYPDYDDYDFKLYESPFISVLGSRGCVRQCTFCDIHEYWEKFYYRSAESIFQEMLYQNKRYNATYFKFQDSLINGNVKEFNKLMELLAEHNRTNPDNSFTWASYFIFRSKEQMPEQVWKLLADSGNVMLVVGIESFVERIRYHMKKKFDNAAIDYGLEMAKKHKLNLTFLLIVGYATETEEDHQEAIKWVWDHKQYAGSPIYRVSFGGTLAILPNTWLDRNQTELNISWRNGEEKVHTGKNHLWEIKPTSNNYETRVRRLNELIDAAKEAGMFVTAATIDPQKELENVLTDHMTKNEKSN